MRTVVYRLPRNKPSRGTGPPVSQVVGMLAAPPAEQNPVSTTGVGTAITSTLPDVSAGDTMVAFVVHSSASGTLDDPVGWDRRQATDTAADFTTFVWTRLWQSGDTAPSWTASVSVNWVVDIYAAQGVYNNSAQSVIAASNTATNAVVPSVDDCLIVTHAAVDATGAARTWTCDKGTEVLDQMDTEQHRQIVVHQLVGGSGVSQSYVHTVTDSVQDVAGIIVAIAPVPAGEEFVETPADTEDLTDTRTFDRGNAVADNLGVTDTRTFEGVFVRGQTDNLGVTDARTVALTHNRTPADTLGLTDTATPVLGREVDQTDTLGLTDTVVTETSKAVAPADTEGLTDTVATQGVFVRGQTDNLGVTDTVGITGDRAATVADNLGLTDTAATAATYTRPQTDNLGVTDSLVADVGKLVTQTDNLGVTDTRTLDRGKSHADNVNVTDALTFELAKVIADDAVLTDAAVIVAAYERSLIDDLELTDIAGSDAGLIYRLTATASGPQHSAVAVAARHTARPGADRYHVD